MVISQIPSGWLVGSLVGLISGGSKNDSPILPPSAPPPSDSITSIWEGMRKYMTSVGCPFDFVLFTSYDRQIEALMNGQIDIAWNGPVAHVRTQMRSNNTSISLGMRDVDCGFKTNIIVASKVSEGLKG
jgi:ABC-type phosphate/phosphonate transport system substrate-binding protein